MKTILAPTVHLLAEPLFYQHPEYKIPKYRFAAEAITAHAGKGCYDSYGKDGRSIEEHIGGLIKSKHGSVLEHANFTLFITGVSRGLSHEFVRHRAGFAYSQRSTRYTEESGAAVVLSPYMASITQEAVDFGPAQVMVTEFVQSCRRSLLDYARCVERLTSLNPEGLKGTDLRKWARGQARQLLPHALETRLTVTGNIRAWRHFFEQRSSQWAEEEIRRLAKHVWDVLRPVCGCTLDDYVAPEIRGFPEFTTPNTKV